MKGDSNISKIEILSSRSNLGDHKALKCEYNIKINKIYPSLKQAKPIQRPKIDWNDLKTREIYQLKLNKELEKLESQVTSLSEEPTLERTKVALSSFLNQISSALITAAHRTQNENETRKKISQKKYKKKKNWWDSTMEHLHNKIVVAYIEYKASSFAEVYKTKYLLAKTNFRKQNLHSRKEKHSKNLNKLFKMERTKFWKTKNKMKNKDIRVEAKFEDIKNEYVNFFNTHNEVKHNKTEQINEKVRAFIETYKNTDFKIDIRPNTIKRLVNELTNGKSIVLMYGLETCDLKKTEINGIKRTEGNIIKGIIGVPTRCKTTDLLHSLNIDETRIYLENQKLDFILRLINNKNTKSLLLEHLDGDGIVHLWSSTAYIFEDKPKTLDEVASLCRIVSYLNKTEIDSEKRINDTVKNIKKVLGANSAITFLLDRIMS
ncbi:unnamed protein product [Brachionus calyciflorus]|uniref:Uncharacterized protein n=1 Tax=Brachionus calyciflorus TaxID=104777 RepID=A0A814LWD6_9BILA|nr:unnamed protein product [Brachionus calyciflorus]